MQQSSHLRPRELALFAIPGTRTIHVEYSSVPQALELLNSVLETSPYCDLFTTGMARLMNVCKRVVEMNKYENDVKPTTPS